MRLSIEVAARSSSLSRAQVDEVLRELQSVHSEVDFIAHWIETTGDKDLKTSLRNLEKSDFFTKEVDECLLLGKCRIAIHSAKDLPDPLPKGLDMIALTQGVDPSDSLVLREGETLTSLPLGAKIGTSCLRREETIKRLRPDLCCVDVRGTINRRLFLVDSKELDGVVMAEAALIRLKLTGRNRIPLAGETAPLQGKLAILAKKEDKEMKALFSCIDSRK